MSIYVQMSIYRPKLRIPNFGLYIDIFLYIGKSPYKGKCLYIDIFLSLAFLGFGLYIDICTYIGKITSPCTFADCQIPAGCAPEVATGELVEVLAGVGG